MITLLSLFVSIPNSSSAVETLRFFLLSWQFWRLICFTVRASKTIEIEAVNEGENTDVLTCDDAARVATTGEVNLIEQSGRQTQLHERPPLCGSPYELLDEVRVKPARGVPCYLF